MFNRLLADYHRHESSGFTGGTKSSVWQLGYEVTASAFSVTCVIGDRCVVKIGNGARIAANSRVINDVPAGATAIGVPARVMRYTGRADKNVTSISPQTKREVAYSLSKS